MFKEYWIEVKGFYGMYEVSNLGNVRTFYKFRNGKPLIVKSSKRGNYLCVRLTKDHIRKKYNVHLLVASSFLDIDSIDLKVNHIDGNFLNNKLSNLEFVSIRENTTHAIKKEKCGSSYTGVYPKFIKGKFYKWGSCILFNKKKIHLGYFDNEIDAYIAYLIFLRDNGIQNKYKKG